MSAPSDGKGSHNLRMGAIYWGKEIAPMMSDRVWRFNYYNLLKLACHSPPPRTSSKTNTGGTKCRVSIDTGATYAMVSRPLTESSCGRL